jgi:hypothetical protein
LPEDIKTVISLLAQKWLVYLRYKWSVALPSEQSADAEVISLHYFDEYCMAKIT